MPIYTSTSAGNHPVERPDALDETSSYRRVLRHSQHIFTPSPTLLPLSKSLLVWLLIGPQVRVVVLPSHGLYPPDQRKTYYILAHTPWPGTVPRLPPAILCRGVSTSNHQTILHTIAPVKLWRKGCRVAREVLP